ncbi:MAG: gliding motility-associated-like protein, partial [Chitinophagales bacterium]
LILTGSGALTYTWNNGATDNVAFVAPVGTTTYTVTGTDVNGCLNLDSVSVLVNPLPIVIANTSANNVCEGVSIALTGSGAQTYTWDNGVLDGNLFAPSLGTQMYQVTGVDTNTCVNTDTIVIITLHNANLLAIQDLLVCDVLDVNLNSGATFISSYQWGLVTNGVGTDLVDDAIYAGVNTNQLAVAVSGASSFQLFLELTGECGNIVFDTIDVVVNVSVPQDRLFDTVLCEHEVKVITANWPGLNFIWSDGTIGQVFSPVNDGNYILSYEEIGTACVLYDTLKINMIDCIDDCVVVAPSGFSPNGDGSNDVFRPITSCKDGYSNYEFKVFDRWGTLLFYTADPTIAWDGTYLGENVPQVTYAYVLSYVKAFSDKKETLTGNITVIR